MAYDEVTHQVVMFGGYDGSSYLGDTWVWDGATSSWSSPATTASPVAVSLPMGFTDPVTGHAMMIGGFNGRFYNSDTWEWTGSDWVQLFPATMPTARGAGVTVLHPLDHRVVMYGGLGSLNINGTWLWDGTDWSQGSPATQPPLTYYSCGTYDPNFSAVLYFGGAAGGPDLNDTWAWSGSDWSLLATGRTPSGRESAGLAYDDVIGASVLFGGQSGTKLLDDTWVLVPKR